MVVFSYLYGGERGNTDPQIVFEFISFPKQAFLLANILDSHSLCATQHFTGEFDCSQNNQGKSVNYTHTHMYNQKQQALISIELLIIFICGKHTYLCII